ncbi:MAG: 50S ribosomal protein L29 [Deltaproteobacteria bacterium]|nr:50S ribosomal protein L29 [Deltaproteobacteria bacterium]
MKPAEIRALTDEQLVHEELRIERLLLQARFRKATGQLDDTSQARKMRKDVARLRTEQRSREIAQALDTDTLRNRFRGTFDPSADEARPARPDEQGAASGFLRNIVDKIKGKD